MFPTGAPSRGALLLGLAALVFVACACFLPPLNTGDASEYYLMAESFFNHYTPDLRPEQDLASLSRRAAPHQMAIATATVLDTYSEARGGRYYGYHFWAYPLATMPARLVLHALGADELKAFQVTNALLFAATILQAAFSTTLPAGRRLAFAALLALGPATWFLLWPHPEVFSASLVAAALVWMHAGRWPVAILCASLASLQNPPLVLFAGFLAVRALWRSWPPSRRSLLGIVAATSPCVLPFVFYWSQYGVPSLLVVRGEAAVANASVRKSLELLFDPNIGMAPYVPVVLGLFLWRCGAALWRRPRSWRGVQFLLLLLAMGWLSATTRNWNHGTSGPSRYVVWMLPFVYYVAAGLEDDPPAPSASFTALLGVAVAAQAAVLLWRGGLLPRHDHLEHSYLAELALNHCGHLYRPSYEIFVSRTLHRTIASGFKGPAVYSHDGACRKAFARGGHAAELERRCGKVPAASTAFFADPANERVWRYVDY